MMLILTMLSNHFLLLKKNFIDLYNLAGDKKNFIHSITIDIHCITNKFLRLLCLLTHIYKKERNAK